MALSQTSLACTAPTGWAAHTPASVCSEEELLLAAARIAAVALLAQPLRPPDAGELDARRNHAYAASLASWTLIANGYELRPIC